MISSEFSFVVTHYLKMGGSLPIAMYCNKINLLEVLGVFRQTTHCDVDFSENIKPILNKPNNYCCMGH